jgi:hypothetical protein
VHNPVNYDPIVLAYARALLTSTPAGGTKYLNADLRDTPVILAEAARTLDFARPVALMLLIVMHLIEDSEDPYKIVATLMDPLPSGSFLVLAHPASDIRAARMAEMTRRVNDRMSGPRATMRDRTAVAGFFSGARTSRAGRGSTAAVAARARRARPSSGHRLVRGRQKTRWCPITSD